MSRICYVLRYTTNNQRETVAAVTGRLYSNQQKTAAGSSSSSSSSSSSDDEAVKKIKKEDPLKKLNSLLQQMIQNDVAITQSKITFSRPSNKRNKQDETKNEDKPLPPEKQLSKAAKQVAESLGGDTKQTESELLKMLSSKENQPQIKSLSDVLKGMKIDRDSKPEISRAQQVRQLLEQTKPTQRQAPMDNERPKRIRMPRLDQPVPVKKIDLFGSDPLGIFTDPSKLKDGSKTDTWEKLYAKDLKLAVTHPPANYFQQLILWTEQGKLWKFPINNEQGLDDEAQVYFADHIFLEEHLEPWCPQKGPIRYFMELVCVGLSKNPYLTVSAKKEHIEWYKNYFEEKRKLLQEVGALPVVKEQESLEKE